MIVSVLNGFIHRCDKLEITPNETHIEVYLTHINCIQYKSAFIKFCLYSWEERNDDEDLEELLFNSLISTQ